MRWRYLFRFYFRQVMKSKLYTIATLMAIILVISRIYLYFNTWFDQEDYGQLPADIVVVVQAVSILYILFFYRLFSNEILYGIQNIFVDGYKIMLEKMSALLLVHVVLQLGITSFVFVMYSGVYALIGIEFSVFYLSLLRFLIVYMLGPIILLFFYGILVALIFEKRKIAIIAILMIWLFTGVINQEIFRDFFTQVSANDLFPLLSIGPESMHLIYLSYIGFNLDVGNELTLLTWFLLLTIIILLLAVKWTSVNREKRATWISALILFVLAIGSGYGVLHFSKNSFNFAATEETSYYQSLREAPTDLDYEIKSYQINMNQNKVDASITFNKTHTNTPTFQLYHAYPVVSVSVDNREVPFEREGDIIKVYSETKEFESLSISYQLVDTSYIPYSANKTTLLANYAWYPKRFHEHMYIDKANPYMSNSYPKLSDSLFTPEVYEFKVKTERILFTNLELKGDHYEGEAQAVTLLRGQGQQLTYNDYEITYPSDWVKMEERVSEVLTHWELIIDELQAMMTIDIQEIPKKVVFSNYGLNSLLTKDHMIYQTHSTTSVVDFNTSKDFEKNLIELMIPKRGNTELFFEWTNMTSQFIRGELNVEVEWPGLSVDAMGFDDDLETAFNQLYADFDALSIDGKRSFLDAWYTEMDESWTWVEVTSLMEEMKAQ